MKTKQSLSKGIIVLAISILGSSQVGIAAEIDLQDYLNREVIPVETQLNSLQSSRPEGRLGKAQRLSLRSRPYAKIGIPGVGFTVQGEVEVIFVRQ